jgi:hypothetical protein
MTANISSIQNGIVFLMAEWSGPAKQAYDGLKHYLEKHDWPLSLLTCINVDQEPAVYDLPELSGKIHGWGEAIVIRNGKIAFVTTLGKDRGQFEARCEELLKNYAA